MTTLPDSLSRKAVKKCFSKVEEQTWDYLFDKEKRNGLFELRVEGPDSLAYYSLEGIKRWLIKRGHYTPADFNTAATEQKGIWAGLNVRAHALT